MHLRVGDEAPDFELDGLDGLDVRRHRLSAQRGSTVVLAFYPADGSRVCTRQMSSYTADIDRLERAGLTLWALSPQSIDSHRSFAEGNGGFAFPLLADLDRGVGRLYGILGLLDLYRRSTVIVGPTGRVLHLHRALGPGFRFETVSDLVAAAR